MLTDPRVLVVTGGSRGIGAQVVIGAALSGWIVCFTYVEAQDAAEELVSRSWRRRTGPRRSCRHLQRG